IVLVAPNNPTGSFLKRRELAALRALAAEHGLALVADEVFGDYPLRPDAERVATLAGESEAPCFVLSGLSKVAGLPQLKAGWMVASGPGAAEALERLEVVADTYLSVSTPVQLALPRLLAEGAGVRAAIAARVRENHAHVRG